MLFLFFSNIRIFSKKIFLHLYFVRVVMKKSLVVVVALVALLLGGVAGHLISSASSQRENTRLVKETAGFDQEVLSLKESLELSLADIEAAKILLIS